MDVRNERRIGPTTVSTHLLEQLLRLPVLGLVVITNFDFRRI